MNRFFGSFPTVYYPYGDDYKLATDILRRVGFTKKTKRNNAGLVDYTVKDGDTADNIAARFYGSPHLHWVVLLVNDIINPYYDWPLTGTQLSDYITRKYGEGFENNPHHFELLGDGTQIQIDMNAPLYLESGEVMLIEGGVYDGLALLIFKGSEFEYPGETIAMITNYQYEFGINQQKREIKLLRPELINQAIGQLQTIIRT